MQLDLAFDILPIFVVKNKDSLKNRITSVASFCGTGFLIAPELFITCWHCVSSPMPKDHKYVAAIRRKGKYGIISLDNIEKDHNGSDLATAFLPLKPTIPLLLTKKEVLMGTNIFTYGYPLVGKETKPNGETQFQLNGRYMEGYVMRSFLYQNAPAHKKIKSYELNFQIPEGLSGAPLIKMNSKEVIGVIYGSNEVASIDQYAHIDATTGKREPEIQRLIQFGLAHYTETLQSLSSSITRGKTLREYIFLK